MTTALYLDTARLGRMTPRAQQALCEFGRLCGEQGGVGWLRRALIQGSDAWRTRYPGLGDWSGVTGLRRSLLALTKFPPDTDVLLAHRSAQLMRLAVRVLFAAASGCSIPTSMARLSREPPGRRAKAPA